ncbi:MAG: Crp/Fnr family transcriptional regulator [Cyclobacteriaceae bacterium]|jgi:CRP-like cAMP-binding protein
MRLNGKNRFPAIDFYRYFYGKDCKSGKPLNLYLVSLAHDHLTKIQHHLASLDQSTREALDDATQFKSYKKNEYLLLAGEVCKSGFQIVSGVARKFYLNDGKEITTELFFADDIAVSLESYTGQKPSREYIQALEPLSASITYYQTFQELKQQHKSLLELDLMMTEYYALWLEERLFQFHTLDATERYKLLLEKQPHFVQQIPLTYLASYLGVSLETLSRIRAKI